MKNIILIIVGLIAMTGIVTGYIGKSKDGTRVQIGSKIILGVVLPLVAFIAGAFLAFRHEISRGGDYGQVAFMIMLFALFSTPAILIINSLLMLPKWQKRQTVWLVGAIFPICLLIWLYFLFANV